MEKTKLITAMKMSKEDFIELVASATPQEISNKILNRDEARRKPYCPIYLFKNKPDNLNGG